MRLGAAALQVIFLALLLAGMMGLLGGLPAFRFWFGAYLFWMVATAAGLRLKLLLRRSKDRRASRDDVLRRRLTTDFETLRVDTAETSTAYRVTSLYRVSFIAGRIFAFTGPGRCLVIPASVFSSPAEAREFATRLGGGARRSKIG